ncbi:MAG: C39 family peptidase [Bacilli bacterium]
MMLTVCNDPKILELVLISKTFINILQIVAPLIVILYASYDILKAVTAKNQDLIKKATSMIPKRLLAMAIVFFIPTLVDMTMNIIDTTFEYTTCFQAASRGHIDQLYVNMSSEKVAEAESLVATKDYKSYDANVLYDDAKILVMNIRSSETRKEYEARLLTVYGKIKGKIKEEKEALREDTTPDLRDDAYQPPDNSISKPGGNSPTGKIPYYNQCDSPWGQQIYFGGSFCSEACGGTSLAMIVAGMGTDSSVDPIALTKRMKALGVPATWSSWDAFTNTNFLNTWKVKGTRINTGSNKAASLSKFKEELQKGHPLIINVINHFLVCDSYSNGKFHILDPGDRYMNGEYGDDQFWQEIVVNYKGRGGGAHYIYFYYERN